MKRLEVSGAVRPTDGSLGVKRLTNKKIYASVKITYYNRDNKVK